MSRALFVPAPPAPTTDRVALTAVALLTAVAVIAAASIPALRVPGIVAESRGVTAAVPLSILITVALGVTLARAALGARSIARARLFLIVGGGLAGAADAILSYAGALLLGPAIHRNLIHTVLDDGYLITRLAIGSVTVGCLFGVAYGPVVVAAVEARLAPSIDALDRVIFAGGASLLLMGGFWAIAASNLTGLLGVAVGALAVAFAGTRIVARLRLFGRVHDGDEPGLHVIPASSAEDEANLEPLMRTATTPTGVLAATGASTPYRGMRGVLKLARVPQLDELSLSPGPFAALIRSVAVELGTMTLSVGIVWMVAVILENWLVLPHQGCAGG